MKITRLGHAAVLVEGNKTIIIDPFLTGNPAASTTVEQLPPVDYVLVTHDHDDHLGDAVKVAQKAGAKLVVIHELTLRPDVQAAGIEAVGMNIGGTYRGEDVSIGMTPAVHSSLAGNPAGFVVTLDGTNIYHAGDTDLFSDMSLIPEIHGKLNVALVPIGGHYTMNEQSAAKAIALLKPQTAIPMHYNTWPLIQADPEVFKKLVAQHAQVTVLEPGQSYETQNRRR